MLISCWSVKGGSGTTVVTLGLAACLRARSGTGVLVVDLAGDIPTVAGLPYDRRSQPLATTPSGADPAPIEPFDPVFESDPRPLRPLPSSAPIEPTAHAPDAGSEPAGVADWLAAGADVPVDALPRLEVPLAPGLSLLARGEGFGAGADRVEILASILAADPRPVVVDAGLAAGGGSGAPGHEPSRSSCATAASVDLAMAVTVAATHSLLVIRPCLLALRRALAVPLRPSGVVLVAEPGRALSPLDVEDALQVPVCAVVRDEPAVARAVDAGILLSSPPRSLLRSLRDAI